MTEASSGISSIDADGIDDDAIGAAAGGSSLFTGAFVGENGLFGFEFC